MKQDVQKQEELTSALWQLLRDHERMPKNVKGKGFDESEYLETNLDAIGKAQDTILKIFGYERTAIF